jgi:pilus assembly protein CpaE
VEWVTKKIRIMVVDDIGETRKNLQRLLELEEDMIVIGEAANGEEAICSAKELQPDIILMDINMPVLDGIQTTKRITTELSHAAIIILSVQQEQE